MYDEDNLNFYEEDSDSSEVKEIKGITDTVSRYSYSKISYPCVMLKDEVSLPKYKWLALSKMVGANAVNSNIAFYINQKGSLMKAGSISGVQVKTIIDLIGLDNLEGFFSEGNKLSGDKLYVLAI